MVEQNNYLGEAMAEMGLKPVTAGQVKQPVAPAAEPTPAPKAADALPKAATEAPAPAEPKAVAANSPAPEPITPKEADVIDEVKLLNGRFGGKFKSLEEADLSYKELEEKSQKDPFHNPIIKGLNDYVAGGGDAETYLKLQKMDIDKMDAREALINHLIVKKDVSRTDAEEYIDSKYHLNEKDTDELGDTIKEVRDGHILAKIDTKDAKSDLKQYKVEHSEPPQSKRTQILVKAMDAELPSIAKDFETLKIDIAENESYEYPIRSEVRKEALDTLKEMVKSGMLDIDLSTTEGKEAAKDFLADRINAASTKDAVKHILQDYQKKSIEEKHHKRDPDPSTPPSLVPDAQDRLLSHLEKTWGR